MSGPAAALWVDHARQCGDSSPDKKHCCTIERGHVGAHVAVDPVFGNPVDAWLPRLPGHPEVRAVRVMAAAFEKLGDEPCSECGYALNEIRDYVIELLDLREKMKTLAALPCASCGGLRDFSLNGYRQAVCYACNQARERQVRNETLAEVLNLIENNIDWWTEEGRLTPDEQKPLLGCLTALAKDVRRMSVPEKEKTAR